MTLDNWIDTAALTCLVLAGLLSVAAGIGLLRFPDALSRMHAATKPQILGLMFVIAAIALADRHWSTVLALLPVLIFQMFTAPISAHMMGRAGYRTGNFDEEYILTDDLEAAVNRATREQDRRDR
ncbi:MULTISPECIES: monovalent cation/H(+) antiporter subunit G [unclassified Salinibacterium]|uniref:monovalent cation/H(+) antiporter subunit G n=1 Tax=unclassified Salinibacterium TaxID=2632331 RepID=UPI0014222547|nr:MULTISPECIES: monovalent cation/H(+) antiporter subunit G [unclassified Salinibacterium]